MKNPQGEDGNGETAQTGGGRHPAAHADVRSGRGARRGQEHAALVGAQSARAADQLRRGVRHSDGYVLFAQHAHIVHNWYGFWDADLGRPVGPKAALYDAGVSGLYIREFSNGWAVYNRSGKAHVISLPEEAISVSNGLTNTLHALPDLDGGIYLRVKPKNPADVNGDGVVDVFDLVFVAEAF